MLGLSSAYAQENTFQCKADQTCVNFVLMNDVYQWRPYPADSMGTLSRVSTYLKHTRSKWPQSQFLFAGDLLSPSPESQITKGLHMVEALNMLKVDVATLGNHEFDFGAEGVTNAIKLSAFPWLGGNITITDAKQLNPELIHPYKVIEQKGKRILVVGVLTPETLEINNVNGFMTIKDPTEYLKKNIDSWIKKESPDLVVALTHLNIAEDRALAAALPQLDAIFGGHDHDQMLEDVNGIPIIKHDSDAKTIGHVQFNLPKQKPHIKRYFWSRKPKGDVTPIDEWHYEATALTPKRFVEDKDFEARIFAKYNLASLDAALGMIPSDWDLRQASVRGHHSRTAQRMAAIMREYGKVDIAIINGGGIRGDRVLAAGVVSKRDMLQALPFNNTPVVLDLNASELKNLFEKSMKQSESNPNWGGNLHASGITLVVDAENPAVVSQILDAKTGKPLDPNTMYRVLVNDYLAQGGNGYDIFKVARGISESRGRLKVYTQTQADFIGEAIKTLPFETLRRLSNESPSVQFTLKAVDQ